MSSRLQRVEGFVAERTKKEKFLETLQELAKKAGAGEVEDDVPF